MGWQKAAQIRKTTFISSDSSALGLFLISQSTKLRS